MQSVGEIAAQEGLTSSYISRSLRLVFLAPDIVERIFERSHAPELTTGQLLLAEEIPLRWDEQRLLISGSSTMNWTRGRRSRE